MANPATFPEYYPAEPLASPPMPLASAARPAGQGAPIECYLSVRTQSSALVSPLSVEDQMLQSMADASPAKWHLAHTTWFFETFVLAPHLPGYSAFDPRFGYLFNSYYEALGERHPRPRRGMLSRPSAADVATYRHHVDAAMVRLAAAGPWHALAPLVELGIHHEQQHQELLLTDILHAFSLNPLRPAYQPGTVDPKVASPPLRMVEVAGGLVEIGHDGRGFAFDNEGPRHTVYLRPFRLAARAVTNGEWQAFMADGGYTRATLWLADGWAVVNQEGWQAPLYWQRHDQGWETLTLRGPGTVDDAAPVCHVSYYEADAFARWAGKRLPTEAEWEAAADLAPATGNDLASGRLMPAAADCTSAGPAQMIGDVWEWTASAYQPYPGFRPSAGAVGEYNAKFMCNQMVLRGGSCVTPAGHIRRTYRNFFYPHQRWQFAGVRLAEDA